MTFKIETENTSTAANSEHRARLLYDATIQFGTRQGRERVSGADQYKELFYSFIDDIDHKTKKLISSHLARNHNTPRSIAYYMALESIDVAAPFLLISKVFWERDFLQLIDKVGTSHLLIIARRSDITPRIAETLVARNNKLINQVLSKNPALGLNEYAGGMRTDQSRIIDDGAIGESIANPKTESPAGKLLKLAQLAGKQKDRRNVEATNQTTAQEQQQSIGERLLKHAKSNDRSLVTREIAEHIGMEVDQVERIVMHENCQSFVVFLKGLELSQKETSQLLIMLNYSVAKNISQLNQCIETFDRLTISQCRDIMKNLGAKKLSDIQDYQSHMPVDTALNKAIAVRRRQIVKSRGPIMFGKHRQSA